MRTPRDWCESVQSLVSAEDVAPVMPHIRRLWKSQGQSTGKAVAAWLQGELSSRRLRYVMDPPARDVWTAPRETIRRGYGDCDDMSLLAASLLRAMRRTSDVVVGHMCRDTGCIGHAWVEGNDEKGFFHLEATTGAILRLRPAGYYPFVMLRPGRCQVAGPAVLGPIQIPGLAE